MAQMDSVRQFIIRVSKVLRSWALTIAELLYHFVAGNCMKFRRVHIVVCGQESTELGIVGLEHEFGRERVISSVK
jgi:hypothetical protein